MTKLQQWFLNWKSIILKQQTIQNSKTKRNFTPTLQKTKFGIKNVQKIGHIFFICHQNGWSIFNFDQFYCQRYIWTRKRTLQPVQNKTKIIKKFLYLTKKWIIVRNTTTNRPILWNIFCLRRRIQKQTIVNFIPNTTRIIRFFQMIFHSKTNRMYFLTHF